MSPISNGYPETFGASLPNCTHTKARWSYGHPTEDGWRDFRSHFQRNFRLVSTIAAEVDYDAGKLDRKKRPFFTRFIAKYGNNDNSENSYSASLIKNRA